MRIALPRTPFSCHQVLRFNFPFVSVPNFRWHIVFNFSTTVFREMATPPANAEFNREDLEDLLKRRFFVSRAFDIYGGVAGLYDLGVPNLKLPLLNISRLDVLCKPTL